MILLFLLLAACAGPKLRPAPAAVMTSPSREIELILSKADQDWPVYSVNFHGRPLTGASKLGLDFKNIPAWRELEVLGLTHRSHDEVYDLPVGKTGRARDRYEEYTVQLGEARGLKRRLDLIVRLYDDGLGFQYFIPAQPHLGRFQIAEERTSFALRGDPVVYGLELPLKSTFEGYYSAKKFSAYREGSTIQLPLLIRDPAGAWIALTEAALSDYGGQYLAREGGELKTVLAPGLASPGVKVEGEAPFAGPWRAMIIGGSAAGILESDLVNNLNKPSVIADTAWIRPGKIIFPWWSGYRLNVDPKDRDPDHKPGLTTWALKKYIDFCAKNKIEFFSFDGYDQAWYGGDIGAPPPEVRVTRAIPAIDMQEVLRYAKKRGVRARIWVHKTALLNSGDLDDVFALYQSWGISGVMVDFIDNDSQQSVREYTRMIQAAARHKLTINFHGVWKGTGLTRTYPNLLSHEAVMSSEYNRFSDTGAPPEHEVVYAWVRQIAGSTDIHPGSFNPVLPQNFDPKKDALRAMGTLARQLALYVVVESGAPMVADAPAEYEARPRAFKFVRDVPSAWDETKFIGGDVGQSVVVARRRGTDWFVGGITDRSARAFDLPLGFLGRGKYRAEIYADGPAARTRADSIAISKSVVTAEQILKMEMAPSGGFALRLRRL